MLHNFDQPVHFAEVAGGTTTADRGVVGEEGATGHKETDVCGHEKPRGRRGGRRPGKASTAKHGKVRGSRSSRALSLVVMAKEYIWLWDVRHGVSAKEIAMREGLNVQRVRIGIARAKALEKNIPNDTDSIRPPRLVPLFPMGAYTPQSACGHHGPIERGSLFCCMVCHCSGIDDHPGLLRSPLTDPAPEPRPALAPVEKQSKHETRKERRRRVFGTHALASSA